MAQQHASSEGPGSPPGGQHYRGIASWALNIVSTELIGLRATRDQLVMGGEDSEEAAPPARTEIAWPAECFTEYGYNLAEGEALTNVASEMDTALHLAVRKTVEHVSNHAKLALKYAEPANRRKCIESSLELVTHALRVLQRVERLRDQK